MPTFEQLKAEKMVLTPDEQKFMCYICEWFIVVPPVFLNPARGFICGFCYQDRKHFVKDDKTLLPQPLYEDIAPYVRFPCKYCEYFTIFNGLASTHELQCSKRVFPCPISRVNRWFLKKTENCEWQDDDGKSMVAHLRENHNEYILPSPFQIRFSDIKSSIIKKHVNVVILNNRKIVSITTENDEERRCIFFRCRSNKFGHPDINYRCVVEFKSNAGSDMNQQSIGVFPLGARILEVPEDYCRVSLDELDEHSIFQFSFRPSDHERVNDPIVDEFDDVDSECMC